MAHELETFGGRGSFVSAREHAWHKLGTVLPAAFTASEAMTHARLGGWNVRKEALQAVTLTDDGVSTLEVPGKYATVRTHPGTGAPDVLGVVGEAYRPIQNEDHCDLLDALVDESGAHFETAGSLKGGRQVFITMKLPDSIRVGGVDQVDTYIAALNSHDGSTAFRLLITPVRVVCANTQAAALRSAKACFSIQHSAGAKGQIQAARDALGLTFAYMTHFQDAAERMLNETISAGEFDTVIGRLWPVEPAATRRAEANVAKRDLTLRQLMTDAPTNAVIRGSRWAAYQSITEYLDHHAPVDGKRDAATVRAERVVSGTVTELKTRAFGLLAV